MGWVLRGDKLMGSVEALLLLASASLVEEVLCVRLPRIKESHFWKYFQALRRPALSMECANWKYEKRLIGVLTMNHEQSLRALTKSTDSFLSCHGVV